METIKPRTGVSLRVAHREAAARVDGDGPEVARSILMFRDRRGGKKNNEKKG